MTEILQSYYRLDPGTRPSDFQQVRDDDLRKIERCFTKSKPSRVRVVSTYSRTDQNREECYLPHHPSQNRLKDPAVIVVVDFDRGVEAGDDIKGLVAF